MKKHLLLPVIAFLVSFSSFAQKAEVLYFKANLPCCHARACDNLEITVKNCIEAYYTDKNVVFTTVRLNDPANQELVSKYNAKSQTVLVVNSKKKKEIVTDISDLVRTYARSYNKEILENEMIAKINESLK